MTNFPSSRRWLCVLAGAVAAATFATSTAPASAAASDPYKEQQNVRQQQKAINGEISTLKQTDAQLAKQLADLDASVRASKTDYDKAAANAANAARAASLARGDEEKTTANYERLRQSTKQLALRLYVHGFADSQTPKLNATQLARAAAHGYMGVLAVARGQDVTEKLAALREQMVKQRQQAEAVQATAAADRSKQQSALSTLQTNRSKQAQLADAVESRLESALAESSALAAVDKALSQEIARRAQEAAKRSKGGGGGGSGNISVGNVKTVNARGITVAASIGDKVTALMDAAKADGIALGGYGYRNSDQQIALRRAHCGTSNYDVYEKPSGQCHPPTARPGASMHERGLAIDFTYQGSIITSHSNPAFVWLNKNAKTYGLYNLASEPWHWSTNGN
jgi:hypothetical protein